MWSKREKNLRVTAWVWAQASGRTELPFSEVEETERSMFRARRSYQELSLTNAEFAVPVIQAEMSTRLLNT